LTPHFFLSLPPFLLLTPAVKSDLCDASVESVSGYFNITGTRDAAYFYWLFESRGNPSTDPLVVWLTGGPVGGEGGRKGRSEGGTRLDMGMGGSEPDTRTLTTSPPSFLFEKGCSSILALFVENGPCSVNEFGNGTLPNPYSWNSNANILWIDQPVGKEGGREKGREGGEGRAGNRAAQLVLPPFSPSLPPSLPP
jgi:hypothetical protein